jgi:chromosome segregation ATPase
MTNETTTNTTTHDPKDVWVFPPPIIPEILQFRLDTGNMLKIGGQRGSLTRCVQKYETYRANRLAKEPKAQAINDAQDDLQRELSLFEIELTKLTLLEKGLERQVQQNKERISRRDEEVTMLQHQVMESTTKANKFLETQNCLSEYEALAKLINDTHPTSQEELQSKLSAIQEERAKVDQEIEEAEQTLKVRQAQFQLLIQYMLDLKRSIKQDEEDNAAETSGHHTVAMEVDDNLYGDL